MLGTTFGKVAADLKSYVLSEIKQFNGITDKFRIMVGSEEEAKGLTAYISALKLLDPGIFDIKPKKYREGWCVRIEWRLEGTPLYDRNGKPNERHGIRIKTGPFGTNVWIHDEVAEAFGYVRK